MPQPKLLSKAWASDGLKNSIPDTRNSGMPQEGATYADGFPSITMTPISTGGKPPSGKDMNGVLYEISAHTVWQNQGGRYRFDQAFCNTIGGYSKGAVLINDTLDTEYISLVDANTHNPNSGNNTGKWAIHAGKGLKASTEQAGIVQLSSATNSNSEDIAATPKAVKAAYDKAIEAINAARGINIPSVGTASTSRAGIVMLDNSTESQAEDRAATPKAVKAAYDKAVEAANAVRAFSIPTASTSRAGIVQLTDRISNAAADAGKTPTTAAVNRAIDELGENVLGRIGQTNTRIDNAVVLTGDQTITGAKIFQADIKVSASAAHAAADRYIRLGADATGAYAVNSKSGKVLYLKHDGNLTYDGNRVLTEADMGRLLPVGAIVSFPRSVANPEGFLKADGTTFNSQTFPDLFRALGNSNTLPDLTRSDIGMTAWFPLDSVPSGWLPFDDIATRVTESSYPELYRLLVAKYGRIAAVPKVADRFIRNAAQGLTVGQVQADEIKQHKHKLPTTSRPAVGGTLTDWVQANETFGTTVDNGLSDNGWGMPVNDQAQTGGGETRPKALVLKLCIKAADTLGEAVFWVKSNGTVNNAGALDASRLAQGLQEKADRNHTHTAAQITDFSAAVSNAVNGI